MSYNLQYEKGDLMRVGECVSVRTGLVFSRKEASPDAGSHKYCALSLKAVTENGQILMTEVEDYYASEALKREYFTRVGDVLLRLSAPYIAVLINESNSNLLIPAHFAILRITKMLDPHYLHWWLTKNKKRFYQMASGGTMMGTISSGYIADMTIEPPPLEQQQTISSLLELANREQQLLFTLSEKKKCLIDAVLSEIISEEK